MSQTITPPSPPSFPASLTIPTNGDALNAMDFKLGVEDPLQSGVEAARLVALGGGMRRRVKSVNGVDIIVQPLGVAVVQSPLGAFFEVLRSTIAMTVTPAGLSANQRYWVYAYDSGGGALDFVASTDAPDLTLGYKTGPDYRFEYVSTFITDSTAAIVNYAQVDVSYIYASLTTEGGGTDGNLLLDEGTAVVDTLVPLAGAVSGGAVPSMASQVTLQCHATTSDTGPNGALINYSSGKREGVDLAVFTLRPAQHEFTYAPIIAAIGFKFQYVLTNAAADTLSVWAKGFRL